MTAQGDIVNRADVIATLVMAAIVIAAIIVGTIVYSFATPIGGLR